VQVPARQRRKGIARERWGFQGAASPWSEYSAAGRPSAERGGSGGGLFPSAHGGMGGAEAGRGRSVSGPVRHKSYPCLFFSVKLFDGVEHGHDVADRDIGLDVMDGIENEAAALAERFAPMQDLSPDLSRRPEGERLLRIHAAQKTTSLPNSALSFSASMPAAETWTGLRMSNPHSINDGIKVLTAPHECLKVFQVVCLWIQSFIRLK